MSRHAALLLAATLSLALVVTPVQALSGSGAEPLPLFARIEGLVKLLLDRALDLEPIPPRSKIGDVLEPNGTSTDDDPPLDGIGDIIEPYG